MKSETIGYISYGGDAIEYGVFDARQSAIALLGFDKVMRYCIIVNNPELEGVNFDFPVQVKGGSWMIEIPSNIGDIIKIIEIGGGTVALSTYFVTLAKKAAEEGFFETGPAKDVKKIIQSAIRLFQWFIRIRKHLKGEKPKHENMIIDTQNNMVSLEKDGVKLDVPIDVYRQYYNVPTDFFDGISESINENVSLTVAACNDNGEIEKERISYTERPYFYTSKENPSVQLFPELKNGDYVELDGDITRNNNKTNTIGFEYKGHILTCIPENNQQLTKFKNQIISQNENKIFASATIYGYVSRDKNDMRPKVIFDRIVPKDKDINIQHQQKLL